jgi:hypothetical protein
MSMNEKGSRLIRCAIYIFYHGAYWKSTRTRSDRHNWWRSGRGVDQSDQLKLMDRQRTKEKNSKLGLTLSCVVISPFMKYLSYTNTTIVVADDEAITLLGGLSQILIFENFQ